MSLPNRSGGPSNANVIIIDLLLAKHSPMLSAGTHRRHCSQGGGTLHRVLRRLVDCLLPKVKCRRDHLQSPLSGTTPDKAYTAKQRAILHSRPLQMCRCKPDLGSFSVDGCPLDAALILNQSTMIAPCATLAEQSASDCRLPEKATDQSARAFT